MAGKRPDHSKTVDLTPEEMPQSRSRTRGRQMIPRRIPNPEIARQRARIAERARQEPGAEDPKPPVSPDGS